MGNLTHQNDRIGIELAVNVFKSSILHVNESLVKFGLKTKFQGSLDSYSKCLRIHHFHHTESFCVW